MEALSPSAFPGQPAPPPPWPAAIPGSSDSEPFSAADLHRLLRGDVEADELEQLLAQVARARGALDVAVGDGLAALCVGERLIGLGYSCLGDYAREALGLQERTAQGLAHLSRELRSRPLLRAVVCAGEVKQRTAEAVLPLARGEAEAGWVERARVETVRALLAAVKRERSGVADLPDPQPLRGCYAQGERPKQYRKRAMLPDGKCLLALARHFSATWEEAVPRRRSRSQRIRERDLDHCQVPGCSRCSHHAHHIIPRSQGGSDDPGNLVALCAIHHHRGIHAGRLRVRGTAPDGLRWELTYPSASTLA